MEYFKSKNHSIEFPPAPEQSSPATPEKTFVRTEIVHAMRRFLLQLIIIAFVLVVIINFSYMLMTWLVHEVFNIEHVYLSSEFQFLGTLFITLIFLFVVFLFAYRRRKRELSKLSEAIDRVAGGNFDTQISYSKHDSMSHVYCNFNKMSSELQSVQILRKDFINSFSHEFKTPIASINGFASLLLEKKLSVAEQSTYLEIIRDESERLSKMTNNTILLTKLSSQELVSATEEYDLGEQLRQCSILLSHDWLKKRQEFSGEFPKLLYHGNRELMQHLWINLISNAIKYTPVGGEITVTLKEQMHEKKKYAVVSVEDSGQGMDEQTLAHIFDPYYQADSSHASHGLGLGLSIAHSITKMCGGSIEVSSKIQEGSCFIITLPVSKEHI